MTHRHLLAVTIACGAVTAVLLTVPKWRGGSHSLATNVFRTEHAMPKVGNPGDETAEALARGEEYAQARTAPGLVLPGAYSAAFASLSTLPVAPGSWAEVTNRPYDSDDPRYRDPYFSNSSGGAGLVSGRITASQWGDHVTPPSIDRNTPPSAPPA